MKLLTSLSLFFVLYFFQINIINDTSNIESSVSFMNTAFGSSCSESTADACSYPNEGGDGACRGCSVTGGGGAHVGGGSGGGHSGGGGRSGSGSGGNGNGNGDGDSNRNGGNQEEEAEERCGNGKTRSQIHSAYISTIAKLDLVKSDVQAAIALDTSALGGTLARYRVPPHVVGWVTIFYSASTGLSLKVFSDRAAARLSQEYQVALATCS